MACYVYHSNSSPYRPHRELAALTPGQHQRWFGVAKTEHDVLSVLLAVPFDTNRVLSRSLLIVLPRTAGPQESFLLAIVTASRQSSSWTRVEVFHSPSFPARKLRVMWGPRNASARQASVYARSSAVLAGNGYTVLRALLWSVKKSRV